MIRHPVTRGVSRVAATSVPAWEKRGWVLLDANAPKPVVLDAAEQLGVTVDPDATRTTIVDELIATDPAANVTSGTTADGTADPASTDEQLEG